MSQRKRYASRVSAVLLVTVLAAVAAAGAGAAPPAHPELNPLFSAQWWLRGEASVSDWAGGIHPSHGVDAVGAWPLTTGAGVVVAVLDSGVDRKVAALSGRLLPGRDFLTGRALTGDPIGHGTQMAALIAGNPPDSDGVYGIAPDARILPLRVGTADGHVIDRAAAAAITHAIRNPRVRVINMSWGKAYSGVLAQALARAAGKRSVLLVAAAGNTARDLHGSRLLPQTFDRAGEITVASSSLLDSLSSFSNHGAHVEVAAPGERILSAFPGDTLKLADGTSPAAAIVSGVAALLFSRYPEATAAQVEQAIVTTCTPAPNFGLIECGGIVNARAALESLGTLVSRPL
jgi:membrane-anchored mycosin MYCP